MIATLLAIIIAAFIILALFIVLDLLADALGGDARLWKIIKALAVVIVLLVALQRAGVV